MQLSAGTLLQGGKYKIEKVLGQGGFGITYLASQTISIEGPIGQIETEIKLAIKEFFMKDICNRDEDSTTVSVPSVGSKQLAERFKQKFVKEAWNISKLKHPHIIKVVDVFEENGTAYYVMEYHNGGSLNSHIKKRGLFSEAEATQYILQIASALDYIHKQNMNHLDVKPDNVLLNSKGETVLIDFGLSKCYDAEGEQTSSTPIGVSVGYAPLEQSRTGGVGTFSPATDIYSLGATYYKMVTGETPPEASEVLDDGLPDMPDFVSPKVQSAITRAMEPRRKKRPQSIEEFLTLLNVSDTEPVKNNEESKIIPVQTISVAVEEPLCKEDTIIDETNEVEETLIVTPIDEKNAKIEEFLSAQGVKCANTMEAVDLGLSVKWSNINWNKRAQKWIDRADDYVPNDISSTEFDSVFISTNGGYRIPTLNEWIELQQKCKWEWIENDAFCGYNITGSNGNSIFLPALGKQIGNNLVSENTKGYNWTSNKRLEYDYACYIYFDKDIVDYDAEPYSNVMRFIRPVKVRN